MKDSLVGLRICVLPTLCEVHITRINLSLQHKCLSPDTRIGTDTTGILEMSKQTRPFLMSDSHLLRSMVFKKPLKHICVDFLSVCSARYCWLVVQREKRK